MKPLRGNCVVGFVLLLASCTTFQIPPQKAAWAQSVQEQIVAATNTHYVYVPVADKEEFKIVECLAAQQGKHTQRIKKDGRITVCVFEFRY